MSRPEIVSLTKPARTTSLFCLVQGTPLKNHHQKHHHSQVPDKAAQMKGTEPGAQQTQRDAAGRVIQGRLQEKVPASAGNNGC